jgi:Fe-S cluster biosynthesis and repair protein YggX
MLELVQKKSKTIYLPPDPRFVRYSKIQAAEILNISKYALSQLIKKQKIVVQDGRISLAEIERYLETHINRNAY